MQNNGSKQAQQFIKKYKEERYVVDFYSDEYIAKITEKGSLNTYELKRLQEAHDGKYKGHLLTIYIGNENSELLRSLTNIYAPFYNLFNLKGTGGGWLHKPDFLFINLINKEIFCIGLGRKNNIFSYELHKYLKFNSDGNGNQTFKQGTESDKCSDSFYMFDDYSIVSDTLELVEELGETYRRYDELPGNADVYVKKNRKDGLYYFVDFENEDGLTKSEVENIEKEYSYCRSRIDAAYSSDVDQSIQQRDQLVQSL